MIVDAPINWSSGVRICKPKASASCEKFSSPASQGVNSSSSCFQTSRTPTRRLRPRSTAMCIALAYSKNLSVPNRRRRREAPADIHLSQN